MTKEHEVFLKNIKRIAKQIADAKTEDQMRSELACIWQWLIIRRLASKNELIDRTLPPLLEAIVKALEQTPPDEDDR